MYSFMILINKLFLSAKFLSDEKIRVNNDTEKLSVLKQEELLDALMSSDGESSSAEVAKAPSRTSRVKPVSQAYKDWLARIKKIGTEWFKRISESHWRPVNESIMLLDDYMSWIERESMNYLFSVPSREIESQKFNVLQSSRLFSKKFQEIDLHVNVSLLALKGNRSDMNHVQLEDIEIFDDWISGIMEDYYGYENYLKRFIETRIADLRSSRMWTNQGLEEVRFVPPALMFGIQKWVSRAYGKIEHFLSGHLQEMERWIEHLDEEVHVWLESVTDSRVEEYSKYKAFFGYVNREFTVAVRNLEKYYNTLLQLYSEEMITEMLGELRNFQEKMEQEVQISSDKIN